MKTLFIGLGRIGLPQALVFAEHGAEVWGYDQDAVLIENLQQYQLPFFEPGMAELLKTHLHQNFHAVSNWDAVAQKLPEIEAIFLTIGTQVPDAASCKKDTAFDLSAIFNMLERCFSTPFKSPPVLIFRTTLPLGSIDAIKWHLEKKFNLRESRDFYLAFVPERLMEGAAIREETTLPKIVGAYSDEGFARVSAFFAPLKSKIIRVKDPKTAEFCKLTDNSYRNTMFSFANELALTASHHEVDVMEVIAAVNTDYTRNALSRPGFVSGYCLGKDPYIFEYAFQDIAKARDFDSLWYYGRRINDWLIDFVVERTVKALQGQKQAKIILLGTSFKEDVDDFRLSHTLELGKQFMKAGFHHLRFFDPHFNQNKYTRLPQELSHCESFSELTPALFEGASAVIVAHRHQVLRTANDAEALTALLAKAERPLYVFDGWNIWRAATQISSIHYEALGFNQDRPL